MNEREKKLIALVVFLFLLLIIYYALYRPIMKQQEEVETQISSLKTELSEINKEYQQMTFYEDETQKAYDLIEKMQHEYPAGLSQESAFELLFDIENEFDGLIFTDVGFSEVETLMYSDEKNDENTIKSVRQTMTTNIELSYNDLKSFLRFIGTYQDRSVVTNLNMMLNEEENLIGIDMTLNQYALIGGGREYTPPSFEDVPVGKDQPFDSPNLQILEENGEARVYDAQADLYLAIKPTQADGNAQVMGLFLDDNQSTYVTSDENAEVTASLRLFYEGEQAYATYSFGGQTKAKQAFELGNALEMALFASKRLSDVDDSSMRMTISNETGVPLYINVEEEDPENPRLRIIVTEGEVVID